MTDSTRGERRKRDAALALSADEFRRLGHELVDTVAAFLERIPSQPVNRDESPSALRELLGGEDALPLAGADPSQLLQSVTQLMTEHSLFNGHPRFLGYVTSSPAPIGMLGDFLAAALNPNVAFWRLAPMASEIESQTMRWIADLAGYPLDCAGILLSGGNMANIVALLAARRATAHWDLRSDGVRPPKAPQLRVLATRETHTWLQKAMDMAGLGTESIIWIPTDARQRMQTTALRETLAEFRRSDELPMMVVATAGTVSTGAIDPLREIAGICRESGVWFHIDGCYGGFAACADGVPADLLALGEADSVALDPHKWLYAPLEAGALLVKKRENLTNVFSYLPPYYHLGEQGTNFVDYGPQNSRGFRALKVWLALRQAGRNGYRKMIGDDIRLARWMAKRVEEHAELELVSQELSITTFRYVPAGMADDDPEALNRLNQELLDRIQRSGEAFVSNAIVGDRYALRACIVNFHTDEEALSSVLASVIRLGREIHGAAR